MATFTLTGTFAHQDAATTPIVNTKISIAADPYPLSTKLLALGKVVETDANGQISVAMTTGVTGLYYVVRSLAKHPVFQPIRFLAPASGTIDISGMVFYNPSGVPPLQQDLVAIRDAALAAVASVKIGTWQASTAYVAGQTVQAPDGSLIKRTASGTSRASYDATEIALWTVLSTTTGTQEQVALKATYTQVIEAPLSPYRYGFVGNGTADDTTALQNTIAACPAGGGGQIDLPHTGNAKITTALNIDRPLTLRGRGTYSQRILASGCDGIHVATGVSDVHLQGFEIAQATRYSTTTNAFVGITVDGTTGSRPTNHRYRDLYVDGFKVGYQTRYLWSSLFDNVRSDFGLQGLMAYGLSTNNVVANCAFSTSGGTGSKGIGLLGQESVSNATVVASEGWMISNLLTFAAEVGIDMAAYNHVYLSNSIIDFCTLYGIRVASSTGAFGNNVTIVGNYVAMNGATGSVAILLGNTVSNTQRRYARITDNELVVYSGSTCPVGIDINGAQALAIVRGNTLQGFSTFDIRAIPNDNIITDNACMSAITPNIYTNSTSPNLVENNIGKVDRTGAATTTNYMRDTLGRKTLRAGAAPTTLTWALGDRVINDVPTVGQPKAWVCTVAGTPGTWVSEGNL
jgi:hypothetical protein